MYKVTVTNYQTNVVYKMVKTNEPAREFNEKE